MWSQVPVGPRVFPAMEQWLVPSIRDIPISGGFVANTIAQMGNERLGYVVVYNGQRQQERIWWTFRLLTSRSMPS